jgi:hypothetical protein
MSGFRVCAQNLSNSGSAPHRQSCVRQILRDILGPLQRKVAPMTVPGCRLPRSSHSPRTPRVIAAALAASLCVAASALAASDQPFSFSAREKQEQADRQEEAARRSQAIAALVSVPCRQRLKNQRILMLVGETQGKRMLTDQNRYQPQVQVIESRLRALGLRTYTQQQITAGIAQAELDAYFKNDPDAALAASKKMGANYILRGNIRSDAGVNPVVRVNEVAVTVLLTLTGVDGRPISDVSAHADSYSGSDTFGMSLTLLNEQADQLVAQLYNDYCRAA